MAEKEESPHSSQDHHHDEKTAPMYAAGAEDVERIRQSTGYIKPQMRKAHDPAVTFEEYHYYAQRTRDEQANYEAPRSNFTKLLFGKKDQDKNHGGAQYPTTVDPTTNDKLAHSSAKIAISDEEWTNASRAFRTAGTGACFYLITTDILGPYGIGFSFGTLGWGPGIALYTVFGVLAGYSGYLMWRIFLGVDSYEFPCRNYGDLGFRTWGTTARHVTNFFQALALLLLLGQVTIQFGENISSMSKFKLCYAVCPLIFVCVSFFLTQIRTLKAYGWVATLSVFLNLLVIFITMGVIANSPPDHYISPLGSAGAVTNPVTVTPNAKGVYPAIIHYGNLPGGPTGLVGAINGLLAGVLAYAGAQLFIEFMAEMRRPRDFLKAMWGAQLFLYTTYLVYGCFIYHFQGQYSFYPSYIGVSSYAWRTVGNSISLIAAFIAAGLYGNIGIKVMYNNLLIDLFNAPPLVTTRGKIYYACIVPIWWIIAFVIAASIPDFDGFVSVISASMLLNMTYTLPPFFALGYDIQKTLVRVEAADGFFDPTTGQAIRKDSGRVKRWVRGFTAGGVRQTALNILHVLYVLGSLSMCGLGMYAAVQGLINAFKGDQLNAFRCQSPLNLAQILAEEKAKGG